MKCPQCPYEVNDNAPIITIRTKKAEYKLNSDYMRHLRANKYHVKQTKK